MVAGGAGGTIKLWDLEEAKVMRTLTGHHSNCMSLDVHPYGSFFASGSLDTTVRVWDIRNKECVHALRGHSGGVSRCKFSPDGRWVASSAEDGSVRLWDLTAGKLLKEFPKHEGEVRALEFHPNEFLLATGAADRAVRFWDLETFDLVGRGGPETSGIRAGAFARDGSCFLTASAEHLRAWRWEPAESLDCLEVPWSKVADLAPRGSKCLGASFSSSFVSVWVADLSSLKPFRQSPADVPTQPQQPPEPDKYQQEQGQDESKKDKHQEKREHAEGVKHPSEARTTRQPVPEAGPSEGKVTVGTEMGDTLLRGSLTPAHVRDALHAAGEESSLDGVLEGHDGLMRALTSRLSNMRVVERFWAAGDPRGAADAVQATEDPALSAGLLRAAEGEGTTLEVCARLLPVAPTALTSSEPDHRLAAAEAVAAMARHFGGLVRAGLRASPDRADLAREERIERCRTAHEGFSAVRGPLSRAIRDGSSDVARAARAALDAIQTNLGE